MIEYGKEPHAEIVQGEAPDQHFYDLYISPLPRLSLRPFGRLVVLHEITQLKQEQARLEQARAQLERIVSERTNELRLSVERLQSELTQRTLAEKRFEEVIESAPSSTMSWSSATSAWRTSRAGNPLNHMS